MAGAVVTAGVALTEPVGFGIGVAVAVGTGVGVGVNLDTLTLFAAEPSAFNIVLHLPSRIPFTGSEIS